MKKRFWLAPLVIVICLVILLIGILNQSLLQLGPVSNQFANEITVKETLRELIQGTDEHTIKLLVMGNSRVARETGYATNGFQEIVNVTNRLAGNGFVIPANGAQQYPGEYFYVLNKGLGMNSSETYWDPNDQLISSHAYPYTQYKDQLGVVISPGKRLQMSTLGEGIPLLPKDKEITLTIYYLSGKSRGMFNITPIETEHPKDKYNPYKEVYSFPSTTINAYSNDAKEFVASTKITLPILKNTSHGRSFTIKGLTKNNVVFRVDALRDTTGGVAISEMGIAGQGYANQVNLSEVNISEKDWKAYVGGYNPDIIIWQYANNQEKKNEIIVSATKQLMDRATAINPSVIHVLMTEAPTPGIRAEKRLATSYEWATSLKGYKGAIVINTTKYLPKEFLKLKASCEDGVDDTDGWDSSCNYTFEEYALYFKMLKDDQGNDIAVNTLHENGNGARAVANAVWAGLEEYIK